MSVGLVAPLYDAMASTLGGVRTTMSTAAAGNTQDFTLSGFGTPKAAIFMCSLAVTDTTPATGGESSLGWTDGTNHRCWVNTLSSGIGNTNNKCRGDTSNVVMAINATGTDQGKAAFNAWITDGVRLTIGTQFSAAYKVGVILIGGADTMAYVGDFTGPIAGNDRAITSPGFPPNLILIMGNQTWNSTNVDNGFSVYGVSVNTAAGITNRGYVVGCQDNLGTSDCFAAIDAYQGYAGTSSNAEDPKSAVKSYDTGGFTMHEYGGNNAAPNQAYLALRLPGIPLYVDYITTPTGTGNQSFTGPGFQPQACIFFPTMCDATATTQTDTRAGACGMGFAVGATVVQHGQSLSLKDGQTSQTAKSVADAACAEQLGDSGTVLIRAAHNAWLSNGIQMNFTITDLTARKWIMLAIGSNTPLAPPPRPRRWQSFRRRF